MNELSGVSFLFSLVASIVVVYWGIPIIRLFSASARFGESSKKKHGIHKRLVSNLGGVAIFASLVIGFSSSGFADGLEGYPYIIGALTLLFFTGLKDDVFMLSPRTKLIVQCIAATAVIFGAGLRIESFYGLFGIGQLPFFVSYLLTLFTMIVVMNAFNLIDGIDGLASGFAIMASLCFGILFSIVGLYGYAVLALFLIAILVMFLVYNFEPAKIFMGDSGSLTVGFVLSILAVRFSGLNEFEAFTNLLGNTSQVYTAVFLVLPLYDTIRVFIRRVAERRSPLLPDHDHLHHIFIKAGYRHRTAMFVLCGGSFVVILFSLLVSPLGAGWVLALFFVFIALFLPTFGIKRTILHRLGFSIHRWMPPHQPDKKLHRGFTANKG